MREKLNPIKKIDIVGWKTSSIRRERDLPKVDSETHHCRSLFLTIRTAFCILQLSELTKIGGYRHIVRVEPPKAINVEQDASPDLDTKINDDLQGSPSNLFFIFSCSSFLAQKI